MSVDTGSVTVSDAGVVTSSGLADVVYQEIHAEESPLFPSLTVPASNYSGTAADWKAFISATLTKVRRGFGRTANALARAMLGRTTQYTGITPSNVITDYPISQNAYGVFRVTITGFRTDTASRYLYVYIVSCTRYAGSVGDVGRTIIHANTALGDIVTFSGTADSLRSTIASPTGTWNWLVCIQPMNQQKL